jgi:hypothetical protein
MTRHSIVSEPIRASSSGTWMPPDAVAKSRAPGSDGFLLSRQSVKFF